MAGRRGCETAEAGFEGCKGLLAAFTAVGLTTTLPAVLRGAVLGRAAVTGTAVPGREKRVTATGRVGRDVMTEVGAALLVPLTGCLELGSIMLKGLSSSASVHISDTLFA